jgi:hypothetical protein
VKPIYDLSEMLKFLGSKWTMKSFPAVSKKPALYHEESDLRFYVLPDDHSMRLEDASFGYFRPRKYKRVTAAVLEQVQKVAMAAVKNRANRKKVPR